MKPPLQPEHRLVSPCFEACTHQPLSPEDTSHYLAALEASALSYHGEPVLYGYLPTVFTNDAWRFFSSITATMNSLCQKVLAEYETSETYRQLWGLHPLNTELIALDAGYSTPIPIMRVDIFLDTASGSYMFCEINTDGTSAMNEDLTAAAAFERTPLYRQTAAALPLRRQELFEPYVSDLLDMFAEWQARKGLKEEPHVAILDYPSDATMQEFEEFRNRFTKRGVACVIASLADLSYQNGQLFAQGKPINLVYRRAVSSALVDDLLAQGIESLSQLGEAPCEGVKALVCAARAGAIALVGSFKTLLAHNKQFFEILWRPETWRFLSAPEIELIKEHVPRTVSFEVGCVEPSQLTEHKDRWILKPKNGSSTIGVYAGQEYSAHEWQELCGSLMGTGYILQEYCTQYAYLNCIPQNNTGWQPYNYITGLFVYKGSFAGSYIRAGAGPVIGSIRGGAVVPSYWLESGDPNDE